LVMDIGSAISTRSTSGRGVYLTNALTGWEPHINEPLPFPELKKERG
jgi:hypothetical protein